MTFQCLSLLALAASVSASVCVSVPPLVPPLSETDSRGLSQSSVARHVRHRDTGEVGERSERGSERTLETALRIRALSPGTGEGVRTDPRRIRTHMPAVGSAPPRTTATQAAASHSNGATFPRRLSLRSRDWTLGVRTPGPSTRRLVAPHTACRRGCSSNRLALHRPGIEGVTGAPRAPIHPRGTPSPTKIPISQNQTLRGTSNILFNPPTKSVSDREFTMPTAKLQPLSPRLMPSTYPYCSRPPHAAPRMPQEGSARVASPHGSLRPQGAL